MAFLVKLWRSCVNYFDKYDHICSGSLELTNLCCSCTFIALVVVTIYLDGQHPLIYLQKHKNKYFSIPHEYSYLLITAVFALHHVYEHDFCKPACLWCRSIPYRATFKMQSLSPHQLKCNTSFFLMCLWALGGFCVWAVKYQRNCSEVSREAQSQTV